MRSTRFSLKVAAQVALLGAAIASRAWGEDLLTFNGLANGEYVSDYFDGGFGSMGSGPGPDYGITWSSNAEVIYFSTPWGDQRYSPATMGQGDYSSGMTMDDPTGFKTLFFGYISFEEEAGLFEPSIDLYSGLDGTGTLLASVDLPDNLADDPNGNIVGSWSNLWVNSPGFAESAVIVTGGTGYAPLFDYFETSRYTAVPGPESAIAFSLGALVVRRGRVRKRR